MFAAFALALPARIELATLALGRLLGAGRGFIQDSETSQVSGGFVAALSCSLRPLANRCPRGQWPRADRSPSCRRSAAWSKARRGPRGVAPRARRRPFEKARSRRNCGGRGSTRPNGQRVDVAAWSL